MAPLTGGCADCPAYVGSVAYLYVVTAQSRARPAEVFEALVHAGTWPSWSPADSAEIEGGGDPAGLQRIGDTRILRTGRAVSRARVTALVADARLDYENVDAWFHSHLCRVELAEIELGGTHITWAGAFDPRLPLSGPLWRWHLRRSMQRMVDGLAAYSNDHCL